MTTAAARARRPTLLGMAAGQVRYQLLVVVRSRLGAFTTLVVPLMLLVALNLVTPEMTLQLLGGVPYADFLTPAMAVFAVVNACYVNVLTSTVVSRESGVLKRLRGTPLPLWAYVTGRVLAAAVVGAAVAAVALAVGVVFFDAHLVAGRLGGLAAVLALASACLAVVALALSPWVHSTESALPAAYGTVLPLAFVSDLFFPTTSAPHWLHELAGWFPLAPLTRAAEATFTGRSAGFPLDTRGLVTVLLWTAGAVLLCALTFAWEPGGARALPRLPGRRRGSVSSQA